MSTTDEQTILETSTSSEETTQKVVDSTTDENTADVVADEYVLVDADSPSEAYVETNDDVTPVEEKPDVEVEPVESQETTTAEVNEKTIVEETSPVDDTPSPADVVTEEAKADEEVKVVEEVKDTPVVEESPTTEVEEDKPSSVEETKPAETKVETTVEVEEVKAVEVETTPTPVDEPTQKEEQKATDEAQDKAATEQPKEEKPAETTSKPSPTISKTIEPIKQSTPSSIAERSKTWSSDFTTHNTSTKPAAAAATTASTWKSDFSTNSTPVTSSSSSTTTKTPANTNSDHVIKVSSIRERSATFAANPVSIPSPSSSAGASSPSSSIAISRERSGTIHDLASKLNNNPNITGGFGPSTPRGSVAMTSRNLPSHVQKSAYIQQSGVRQGSLANFVGTALGVQHKGEHTGLVKSRYDAAEERARLEHKNRGANKDMALVMERAVSEAKASKASGAPQPGSIAYLARKLEAAQTDK